MKIVWAGSLKVLDITAVYLNNRAWLLEDPKFVKAVLIGASCVYDEDAFLVWLRCFMNSPGWDSKTLADNVSLIRIKRYRPEVYEQWKNINFPTLKRVENEGQYYGKRVA